MENKGPKKEKGRRPLIGEPAESARKVPEGFGESLKRMWSQRAHFTRLTAEHEWLARWVGKWRLHADYDFAGYGPTFQTSGRARACLINDGRMLRLDTRARVFGRPFRMTFLTGYDTVASAFQTTAYMSTNNGFVVLEGSYDDTTETLREFGEISNAMFRKRHDIAFHRRLTETGAEVKAFLPDLEGKFFEYFHCEMERLK